MLEYVVEMRRKIHEYPEIGFDLPKTTALVKSELQKFGIEYTEKYGKSSIVGIINNDKKHYTIGIRADMDALPILEKTELPFKSKLEGQMHACGHDSHTAILLDVARRLSEIKDQINCRIMLVFQAAEEYAPGGAKLMAEDGLMDEIDEIISLHNEPTAETGKVDFIVGPQNAISNGFVLDFYGLSAHVANQERGIDAITMAVKAYTSIEMMIAKEVPSKEAVIFNVGAIKGGEANNVICDHCSMFCTLRSFSDEVDKKVEARIRKILEAVALESGGRTEFTTKKRYPYVLNDEKIIEDLKKAAIKVVGEENIGEHKRGSGGEDFGFFTALKPGAMFRLGIRNEQKNCIYTAHQDKFDLDEDALKIGSDIFVEYVKQNHNRGV